MENLQISDYSTVCLHETCCGLLPIAQVHKTACSFGLQSFRHSRRPQWVVALATLTYTHYSHSSTMVVSLKLALIVANRGLHLERFCIRLLCTWHASSIFLLTSHSRHRTHQCRLVRPPPAIECWRCCSATRWRWCFVWAPPELDRELSPYYLQHVPLYNTTVAIIV